MDLLDRFLGHDAWTTRQMLLRCRGLSDEELDREFDIGFRTLRRTFLHIVWNMEVWTDLLAGLPVRPNRDDKPEGRSIDGIIQRLDTVAAQFADVARRLQRDKRLDEIWVDRIDDPPTTKSYGATIVHVITHSMHHRAQVLYLMRLVGVKDLIEGDVLSWEKQLGAKGGHAP